MATSLPPGQSDPLGGMMTVLDTAPQQLVASPPDASAGRPSYRQVVEAIMAESGCTEKKAQRVYQFLAHARNLIRVWRRDDSDDENCYHLSDKELRQVHDVLDLIMPDNQTARDGSAHALLNRRLLRGNELTFVHTKVGEVVVDCAIAVHITCAG